MRVEDAYGTRNLNTQSKLIGIKDATALKKKSLVEGKIDSNNWGYGSRMGSRKINLPTQGRNSRIDPLQYSGSNLKDCLYHTAQGFNTQARKHSPNRSVEIL